MTNELENASAVFAYNAYAVSPAYQLPLPPGWSPPTTTIGTNGFAASVYSKGTDVVIAFRGTAGELGLPALADWYNGNIPAGLGHYSPQVAQAIALVAKVQSENPNSAISFTGHSLGGGLASLMAVFFNRPAYVFDPAPFALTAMGLSVPVVSGVLAPMPLPGVVPSTTLRTYFEDYLAQQAQAGRTADAFFTQYYTQYLLGDLDSLYAQRASKVSGAFLVGEAVDTFRQYIPYIGSPTALTPIDAGVATFGGEPVGFFNGAIEMHSMRLLLAMIASSALRGVSIAAPYLIEVLTNKDLYAATQSSVAPDFLTRLLKDQLIDGVPVAGRALDRFAADVTRLGTTGSTHLAQLENALIATVMEYYHFSAHANISPFVSTVAGGVSFDVSAIPANAEQLGQNKLLDGVRDLVTIGFGDVARTAADNASVWTIQTGAGGLFTEGSEQSEVQIGSESQRNILYGAGGNDVLITGYGSDELQGGANNDLLLGGRGDDWLNGGTGADRLVGADGFDYYVSEEGSGVDTIDGDDNTGRVVINGTIVSGGESAFRSRVFANPSWVWSINGQWFRALLVGGTPDINEGVVTYHDGTLLLQSNGASDWMVINHYSTGDLGLNLFKVLPNGNPTVPDPPPPPRLPPAKKMVNAATQTTSPLILDLDGDGVETTPISFGTAFDHDANGFAEATGWVSTDDGLLVRDLNGNGLIDSGRELFGNNTLLANGSYAANGFAALASLDSNNDGVINVSDAAFTQLRIWRDANGNGVTDAGELGTLASSGITSINTAYVDSALPDVYANEHRQLGTYTNSSGQVRAVEDVWFAADTSTTVNNSTSLVSAAIAALPDVAGTGNVLSLHRAMQADTTGHLQSLVEQYAAATNPTTRASLLQSIIYAWTGVESLDPNSRGSNLPDARVLYALEAFAGVGFIQGSGSNAGTPNPATNAAAQLLAAYAKLAASIDSQLMEQTHLLPYLQGISVSLSADGSAVIWDVSSAVTSLASLYSVDASAALATVASIYKALEHDPDIGPAVSTALRAAGDLNATGLLYALAASGSDSMVQGTEGAETLTGSSGNDIILAMGGNDTVNGSAGNDELYGGPGNDTLSGGTGSDVYAFNRGDGQDTINNADSTTARQDVIRFSDGIAPEDVTLSRSGNDLVIDIAGSTDRITVTNHFQNNVTSANAIDALQFASGSRWNRAAIGDRVLASAATQGADTLIAFTSGNVIHGLGGNDVLTGSAVRDQLYGDAGDDTLSGGVGDDRLEGGTGADTLNGGAGVNTYYFRRGDGSDLIQYNFDTTLGKASTLEFGAGIVAAEIQAKRVGSDLVLKVAGTTDQIQVQRFFYGDDPGNNYSPVQLVRFADGTTWTVGDIVNTLFAGTSSDDAITGTLANDTIQGQAGDDTLDGAAGDDILIGGLGNDVLDGGAGNNTYRFALGDGADTIESYYGTGVGVGTLELGAGIVAEDLRLTQDAYGECVIRMVGSDSVTARGNYVAGTYGSVQFPLQQIRFADNTTLGLYVMGTGEAVLDMASVQAIAATGNTANNTITGTALSNILDGGLGSDLLLGGAGDDYYVVDTASSSWTFDQNPGLWNFRDVVSELAGGGYDSINAVNVYSAILPENVERLVITGNLAFSTTFTVDQDVRRKFIGNALDNVIDASKATGPALGVGYTMVEVDSGGMVLPLGTPLGETVLDGGSGADLMIGPTTTTRFVIDNPGDVVISHSTITRIDTTISYVLPAGFDDLRLMGSAPITATGNADDNIIDGIRNSAANVLTGGAGNDTYGVGVGDVVVEQVDGGNDTIVMFAPYSGAITYLLANYANVENFTVAWSGFIGGTTHLIGTDADNVLKAKSKNDILDGGGGNDTLDGGTGTDAMTGGTGNDLYIVDDVGDSIVEAAGEGIDSVQASVSWTLGLNVENLALTGTAAINATGNDLANVISGNSAANVLSGGAGNDWLDGAAGADSMIGGMGDDTFVVDNAGDSVTEAAGGGADTVQASISYALSADVEDLVLTGQAANGTGNSLNNTLTGTWGVNVLDGGAGADTMMGGNDGDTYVVDNIGDVIVENAADWGTDVVLSSVSYTLSDNVERLTLTGTANIDATGNSLDNVLTGNTGANHLIGGLGNDTYVVGAVGDVVTEQGGEGVDLVQSSISYVLGANLENLSLIGSAAMNGTGNALDNAMSGNSAANALDGGLGADVLIGWAGDDTYYVDNAGDVVTEYSGYSDVDTVVSTISWTLAANVEQLALSGASAIDATGNTLSNVLTGNGANNVLNGLSGADTMIGGAGNDTYVVDNTGDVVTEQTSAGVDSVLASVTHTLAANVENLTLTGTVFINGTGNALDNVLTGNTGTNVLTGGAGNDTYVIQNSADTTVETAGGGTDTVQSSVTHTLGVEVENLTLIGSAAINATGNSLNNVLIGNAAANTLSGGAGADAMTGAAGDDTYVVDNAGDTVTELLSEGVDLVQSSVTWVLGDNVENLTLTGSSAINGTGNALSNVLTGNTGTNILTGGAGDDSYVVQNSTDGVVELAGGGIDMVQSSATFTLSAEVENLTLTGSSAINGTGNGLGNVLIGNSGANTLTSGAGNDVLDGGSGTDTMVGGTGDDLYIVNATAEILTELAGEGTDSVQSSATYTLAANVENLTLTGTAAINATGNALANVLIGNSANNTLNGGAGSDIMSGGLGNDSYVVDDIADVVTEQAGEGTDTIQSSLSWALGSSVENLTLTGSATINATGNSQDNILTGNTGVNVLTGGLGNDTYAVQNATDVTVEAVGEGSDTVQSSVTWTLGANVENLTLTGSSAINGTGNSLDNVLNGNSGINTLDGGTGVDTLAGGAGNDVYVVNSADDVTIELSGGGTDTVQSSVSWLLSDNIENLTLTGSAALNGVGNALDNVLTGNVAANVLSGGMGNDTYVVDQVGDVVTELAGEGTDTVQSSLSWALGANLENLTLIGSAAINGTGNALDNILTGNSGVNTLTGGAGNDTYVVQNATDAVVELAGEGTDSVQSSVAWTLGATLENLTLTGSSAINGTGNALDNALIGNSGSNTLTGDVGNDSLDPGSGGTDVLRGGVGDDTYTLTRTSGVTITENANEGIDLVRASVTHTLTGNVELLFQTGSSAINGTGNTLANLLRGNGVVNTLVGGGGTDILEGGDGNDILSNTSGNTLLNGGLGSDTLTGTANNDLLIGGVGNDALTTGAGADIIAFNKGDGADTVAASTTTDNTLSLGGGTTYADLVFQKSGNDLILKVGASDQITFTGYYASSSNRSVNTLQLVIEGTSDYDAGSGNAMNNKKVETFNFGGLVAAFDAALVANPSLTSWALTNALATQYLSGSDTAALGGDLAYRYNLFGTLSDISFTPAQGILGATGFGSSAQALQALASLQDGTVRLG